MGTIELFVVICTVVLFCSWGYLIWSNWDSDKLIRFPPYGFDACPVGFILNSSGNQCESKKDYNTYLGGGQSQTKGMHPSDPTGIQACELFERVQGEKLLYDGIPNQYSHGTTYQNNKMYTLLNNCCNPVDGAASKEKCNSLQFARIIGKPDSSLKDEEEDD